jgi:hypothetical protein
MEQFHPFKRHTNWTQWVFSDSVVTNQQEACASYLYLPSIPTGLADLKTFNRDISQNQPKCANQHKHLRQRKQCANHKGNRAPTLSSLLKRWGFEGKTTWKLKGIRVWKGAGYNGTQHYPLLFKSTERPKALGELYGTNKLRQGVSTVLLKSHFLFRVLVAKTFSA